MAGELVKAQSNVDGKLNRRSTEQREIILETIQRADKHLDADEIYQLALVCTLPVPAVVKLQIEHSKGGKKTCGHGTDTGVPGDGHGLDTGQRYLMPGRGHLFPRNRK